MGKVDEEYKDWYRQSCQQSDSKSVSYVSLFIRVEVGSERSVIGKTFHKRETPLKKKCWVVELEDLWWINLLG